MERLETRQSTSADNGHIAVGPMPERICERVCELAAERGLSVESLMESLLAAAPRALGEDSREGAPRARLREVSAAYVVEMVRENRSSGGLV